MNNDIVKVENEGDVGFICLNNPPVNALGVALRGAIYQALQSLLKKSDVKAIVLYSEGRYFSAGADIKDFHRSAESPTLPELLKALNNSPVPTIAALHGIAFGGALELALATQLRIATNDLRVALPEVKLGLLPGAGGTQRLPRLIGMKAALDIICTGREVDAAEALELGIVSQIDESCPRVAGLRAAKDVLSGVLSPMPTDSLSTKPDDTAIEAARQRHARGLNAPKVAIDSIASAALPIDEGLSRERELFMQLMGGEERAGLVHAFFAERATSKIPEQATSTFANNSINPINSIGIVGGGTMGVGIATAFLLAGFPVTLIELQSERVEQAKLAILKNLDGALKRGKLNVETHAAATANLICSADLDQLAATGPDLVIEAIFEDMQAKTDLFASLDKICKPEAILATNTSYLDINQIAGATSRPQQVLGLHFFSPAHIMRLLEVVVASKTAPEIVATTFDLAKKIRKIPVRAEVCDGFIGNRILTQYRKCTEYLMLDGADFEQIDKSLEDFGFAMGPFAVSDLAGLDIARATRQRKAATRPTEERYSNVADLICDKGWYGRKTGQGYYLYEGSKARTLNPDALEILKAERASLGLDVQQFSDEEIVARCMTAMIMEAVNVLDEGIALRPVDIDAVELFGYGFPRHRGGPMHLADQMGLDTLIERIESYAKEDAYFWKVPPLLRKMQQNGQKFTDLNSQTFHRA